MRILKYVAVLAVALTASTAYAQSPVQWNPFTHSWELPEWARPFNERPGFENLNDCQTGFHGVPAANGDGFRCVQDGY